VTDATEVREPVMAERTFIAMVLDRSGSMQTIRAEMEGALNAYIEEQQKVKGKCRFTFAQFDDEYELIHDAVKLKDVPKLSLVPRNMTALHDAMGKLLTHSRAYVDGLPDDKKPVHKLICVVTDGGENSSREWNGAKVAELVKAMEADNWQITFLGANQDAVANGTMLNVSAGNSMTFAPSAGGVHNTMSSYGSATASLRKTGVARSFTDEERKEAMKQ
jgi:hypothetical protein